MDEKLTRKLILANMLVSIILLSALVYTVMNMNNRGNVAVNELTSSNTGDNVSFANEGNYMFLLVPPPDYAIKGPIIMENGENISIPPLDTSNVFIVAYYNAGQEINLTQAAQLPGLVIDRWGFSYFDGRYTVIDPVDVPIGNPNREVNVYIRVRSDGWILAWISKNQSIGDIVLSGLDINDRRAGVGFNEPWIYKKITTLSYTIYMILVQIGMLDNDDSDGDGIPDDLVLLSNSIGYYDYKYAEVNGSYGYIAVFGARSWAETCLDCGGRMGENYGLFDFTVSPAYTVNESIILINAYLYKPSGLGEWSGFEVKYGTNTDPPTIYSRQTCTDFWCSTQDYVVRYILNISIQPGTTYYSTLRAWSTYNYWGYSNRYTYTKAEMYIVLVGVLKS